MPLGGTGQREVGLGRGEARNRKMHGLNIVRSLREPGTRERRREERAGRSVPKSRAARDMGDLGRKEARANGEDNI